MDRTIHCRLLSIAETLHALGVGRTTLYAKLKAGELSAVKCGRRTLVPLAEVERFASSLKSYAVSSDEGGVDNA